MIANVNGKDVCVMNENGSIVRRIRCPSEAVAAYVSGNRVNVQLTDGHSIIYDTNGCIVRRM